MIQNIKYIFWGIGKNAHDLLHLIPKKIIAFTVDTNPALHGSTWNGLDVCDFRECLHRIRRGEKKYVFLITPTRYQDIVTTLQTNGINNYISVDGFLKQYMIQMYMNGKNAGTYTSMRKREILEKVQHPCYSANVFSVYHIVEVLCGHKVGVPLNNCLPAETDLLLVHGIMANMQNVLYLKEAHTRHISYFFVEDGYLSSICPVDAQVEEKFRLRYGLVLGRDNIPINAKVPSDLEYILNSDFSLSKKQTQRVKNIIATIRKNCLSKYNYQTLDKISFPHQEKKKILVVDQVYGDKSIEFGNADEKTFQIMLQAAIDENPDADIFVKTHPVKQKGHFSTKIVYDNVYMLCGDINPICLLEEVDKVYVCTSQMGFEAAFCGKEVHVFGMPFYAGWGITKDRQICNRRRRLRSVEEIFYAAYILETIYVSHKMKVVCEIEQVVDELIEMRYLFWSKVKHESNQNFQS